MVKEKAHIEVAEEIVKFEIVEEIMEVEYIVVNFFDFNYVQSKDNYKLLYFYLLLLIFVSNVNIKVNFYGFLFKE